MAGTKGRGSISQRPELGSGALERLQGQAQAFAAAAEVWAMAEDAGRPAHLREIARIWGEIGATLQRAGVLAR